MNTPRTDAAEKWTFGDNRPGMSFECVTVEFAKQLEYELAVEQDEVALKTACINGMRAKIEHSRRDYLDVADSLLRESKGPGDLVKEARRLRAFEAEARLLLVTRVEADRLVDADIRIKELEADMQRLQEYIEAERQGASLDQNTVTAAIEIMVERGRQINRWQDRLEVAMADQRRNLCAESDRLIANLEVLKKQHDFQFDECKKAQSNGRRWEEGFRNVAGVFVGSRKPFEIVDIVDHVRRIVDHYGILRASLVEHDARTLYGGFQAAANGKDMEYCRIIANARLRGKCLTCDGRGTTLDGEQGAQTEVACKHCEGQGFVDIPDLEWFEGGKLDFSKLPHSHPQYDGAPNE